MACSWLDLLAYSTMPWPAFHPPPQTDKEVTEWHRAILRDGDFQITRLDSRGASKGEWWNLHADFWVTSRFGRGDICVVDMVNDMQKVLLDGQYTAFYYPNRRPPALDRLVDLNIAWLVWDKDIGSSLHDQLGPGLEDCRLLGPLLVVKHDITGKFVDIPKRDMDMVLNLVKSNLMRRNSITGKRYLDGFEGVPLRIRNGAPTVSGEGFIPGRELVESGTLVSKHGPSHMEKKGVLQEPELHLPQARLELPVDADRDGKISQDKAQPA
ncbi:hypothetical protein VNI00_018767 [Paramarasmius palmivorus]|uniref:Uncharacterized protein n=1 Tax=Paramarasmius palmivorus TaxID=297713 RepID=A0AAW0AUM8_9AGAR